MPRFRWRPAFAAALLLLSCLSGLAAAHGAALVTYVTLDPAEPQPGQLIQARLEVVDAYGNPVGNLQLKGGAAAAGADRPSVPMALTRVDDRTFAGQITFPAAGQWQLKLEAQAFGEPYAGELPVTVGEGAPPVRDVGLELAHRESVGTQGLSWGMIMILGALAIPLGAGVWALWRWWRSAGHAG